MTQIEILKDVLIRLNEVERFIGNSHSLDLWRATDTIQSKELFELSSAMLCVLPERFGLPISQLRKSEDQAGFPVVTPHAE